MRRLMLDLSQTEIGDALGLTFQQVQKYERGTNRISASRLQQLCKILQVPITFFFEGAPRAPGLPKLAEAEAPGYVSDFLATAEGLALVKAFTRIHGAKLRRAIVALSSISGLSKTIPRSHPAPGHRDDSTGNPASGYFRTYRHRPGLSARLRGYCRRG
jgi:transcriptional regulator with XRE-family HTH domain